ncbi:hypothetical protein PIN31009_01859 [Pandoraea iniqua]|uniref:hypothetical protein n=1 Tax=Pandoraea iniqua TaxID=2508288 RepID=UPI001240FDD4|nr:hypothetical protein [Pandoraea iniqua]VVD95616.1 hypothetical protein PIN31009_01859 [Pandoraea iniqua]
MIFVIGFALAIVFGTIAKAIQPAFYEEPDVPDFVCVALFLIGIIMMLVSLCMLAWRYLP